MAGRLGRRRAPWTMAALLAVVAATVANGTGGQAASAATGPPPPATPARGVLATGAAHAAARANEPAAVPAADPRATGVAAARRWRRDHAPEVLAELRRLLAIPNVASDLSNIRANAEAIAAAFRRRGAAVELLTLPDAPEAPPIVFGTLPAEVEDAPTLVLYVHYDGQPVDPERWTTPPWEPALYSAALEAGGEPVAWPAPGEEVDPEWRIYGRSAGDDKAPLAALLAALDALDAAGVPRRVNVKLFFEGEEEAGSPHLARYVERYADRLAADAWLFLDGPVHQSGRPQLFFGVRGYSGFDVTVYGANRYLHSGHYGNWAPNPGVALAHLVAGMKAPDGRVLIDGFYDSAAPLGEAERRALAAVPPFEDALRHELALAPSATEGGPGERYGERISLPSLNLRGMASATVGETARNVIPPSATASFDVRLVAGNDPAAMLDLVEAHLRREGWHLVLEEPTDDERRAHPRLARLVRREGYRAVRTPMDLPASRMLVVAAAAASETELVLLPTLGGSLPLYVVEDALATPLVGVPIANHDDNQHAPDENLRLANLFYGIDLLAAVLAGGGL
jgi:acetylornithine deacetylase/succinyl-diaminopimelate desuccinylase-like protein